MTKRKIIIYNQLFNKICSKNELAKISGNVSTKTIENTIKECADIRYSKKLGGYIFYDLLPSQISYQNYFKLFQDNLSNPILKQDLLKSVHKVETDLSKIMIDTATLSELSKKIIKANIAINHQCILNIYYLREGTANTDKYIKPKQIITFNAIYYLTFEYDKRNKTKGLDETPFAFNGIQSMAEVEYLKDEKEFREYDIRNTFGTVTDANKKVTLTLEGNASSFFMREGLFESPYYKFIKVDSCGEVLTMEMVYNNVSEVEKLVQQWLPLISIVNNSMDAKEVIARIKENCQKFVSSESV